MTVPREKTGLPQSHQIFAREVASGEMPGKALGKEGELTRLLPPGTSVEDGSSHGRGDLRVPIGSERTETPKPRSESLLVLRNENSDMHDRIHRLLGKDYKFGGYGLHAGVEERHHVWDSFAQAPAPLAILSGPDHTFTLANDAYCALVDREREQILDKPVREVYPEFQGQGFLELLDRVYCTGKAFDATEREVRIYRHGRQELIYMNFTYYPVRDLDGTVHSIVFMGVDITQQVLTRSQLETRVKERTAELQQMQEELGELNHKLVELQVEERRRLARELHDSAGQWLAALQWKLVPLADDLAPAGSDLAKRAFDCVGMLDQLSKELRTLSHLLHPPLLEEAGLRVALQAYVDGFAERSGLEVSLELSPELAGLTGDLETNVFRIVQEALTNIQLHARTRTATVRVGQDNESVRVEIQDQGRGIPGFTFSNDAQLKLGVGLRGIRERVRQMHGQFELRSSSGGTTVVAILPRHLL